MNYKGSKELCLALKKNIYKLNNHQRMQILLSVISEIPDSLSLIGQMGLIDPDRVRVLLAKGATGYTICQALLNMIEVKAPDSDELSLKVYGYVKPITPVELNNFIDLAVERIQQQELEGYDFWYADYHEEPQCPYAFKMWQYSETGEVPGITGHVDLDLWFQEEN